MCIRDSAETITRMTIALDNKIDENSLYVLLNSDFPAIQKASFVLLRHFYENFVPYINSLDSEVLLEDTLKENLMEWLWDSKIIPKTLLDVITAKSLHHLELDDEGSETRADDEDTAVDAQYDENHLDPAETNMIRPRNYAYVLTWISLILKLKSNRKEDQAYEKVKTALVEYMDQRKEIHTRFLDNIFFIVKRLSLTENEKKGIVKPNEVASMDPDWSDFLSQESLFKVIIQAMFLFASKFPSYLRKWVSEANKSYVKIAENCVRNFISLALFNNEIELIENNQSEWRSEEFTIFVIRNTRQISAVYTKESAKLEIEITIPPDYPLIHVQTNIIKGVKIPEGKINKWVLMMRSLMINQNNPILSSLMIWKKNIDKQFEGIEECAICYYCIGPGGELPKLACKTCKHKFHSSCIQKWFQSSNKSECPLCKSQFLQKISVCVSPHTPSSSFNRSIHHP
eukprot:TRINITY_DN720_c0_g1_i6.p1 TRINITY_DN720_c0_g1~~TRINITY_DN720_c0_g1_i6.p1  ORF type:complete len:457 (+),score=158.07 TRINITY_DN720_c0_g1_i6:81-1451(+)